MSQPQKQEISFSLCLSVSDKPSSLYRYMPTTRNQMPCKVVALSRRCCTCRSQGKCNRQSSQSKGWDSNPTNSHTTAIRFGIGDYFLSKECYHLSMPTTVTVRFRAFYCHSSTSLSEPVDYKFAVFRTAVSRIQTDRRDLQQVRVAVSSVLLIFSLEDPEHFRARRESCRYCHRRI